MYLNVVIDIDTAMRDWLTLTWDVFKFIRQYRNYKKFNWLTLTWDVFKSRFWYCIS